MATLMEAMRMIVSIRAHGLSATSLLHDRCFKMSILDLTSVSEQQIRCHQCHIFCRRWWALDWGGRLVASSRAAKARAGRAGIQPTHLPLQVHSACEVHAAHALSEMGKQLPHKTHSQQQLRITALHVTSA